MRIESWFITVPGTSEHEVLKMPINDPLIAKFINSISKTNMKIYHTYHVVDDSYRIIMSL